MVHSKVSVANNKQSQLCCVENTPATYLREQYLNGRATGGAVELPPDVGRETEGG